MAGRIQRQLGELRIEILDDHRRVVHDRPTVVDDGYQILAADGADIGAIAEGNIDVFGFDVLVAERQLDAFHVGRIGESI